MSPVIVIYIALVGLMVGSYLNVLIHRMPTGKSTVLPRSSCTYCGGKIRAIDNIPVISFLRLGRKCRLCGAPISWRYPLVEIFTSVLFLLCLLRFGPSPQALVAVIFCSLLVVLAGIDFDHFLLLDKITLSGIVVGLALQPFQPAVTFLDAVLGVLVGAGLLILLINFWYWLRGEEGMGLGDVNMLAMIGAFLGWQGVLTTLVLAAVIGAIVGLLLMAFASLEWRSKLPFGVFLAIGGLLSLFLGPELIELYLGLLGV